jgi:CubicO group peptidase (beta-lactamase class C family)
MSSAPSAGRILDGSQRREERRRMTTSAGLSLDGLAHLHSAMVAHVERGALPGLITLVAHHGEVHVDVIGSPAFGDSRPLARDDIFRIASLTKPISALAALMLIEDGVLRLDDAVDELLPELANPRVLRTIGAELDDTVPARRSITVDDLLTFRLGFGCLTVPPGTYPIQVAEEELELKSLGPPWPPTPHMPDAWIARLGSLPLMCQPGEQWLYNTGAQVLGVLIERAAGVPLETYLRERLFGPLAMDSTGFSVPPEQIDRLTTAYTPDPQSESPSVLDDAEDSYWSVPPAFPSAAGWLVSTIDDYWAFVQLLLSGGEHHGTRIVSQSSIDLMTSDHLTRAQRESGRFFLGEGGSWGFGLRVPAAGADRPSIPGGYGWDGGTGTTWSSDVARDLTGILFTQRELTSPQPRVFADFWDAAYGALQAG